MATSKLIRVKQGDVSLVVDNGFDMCEGCASTDIKKTREGYVCRNCGLVLSSLVLEYHRPYEVSTLQHAPERGTKIGSYKERITSSQSKHLIKLNRLDSERAHEEDVKRSARSEIRRILSGLNLSLSEVEPVFKKFCALRGHLRPGTKFRSVEKLVPITINLYFKLNCKGVNEQKLLGISKVSKHDFNAFKLQLKNYIPYYCRRDRKKYILQKILQITEEYKMGMEFYNTARKIMYKFWEIIKNTKDDVIAGVVCSIVALCVEQKRLKVNAICSHLGIQMSTIQRQVEHNVFNHLRVKGFTSLVRSSDLLKDVMVGLGLIEPGEEILSVVQIMLGKAVDVYNAHNGEILPITPCMLVIETTSRYLMFLDPEYRLILGELVNSKHIILGGVLGDKVLSVQYTEYEFPKGPPQELYWL